MTLTNKPHRNQLPRNLFRWVRRYPSKTLIILSSVSIILGVVMIAPYFLLRIKRLPPVDLGSLGGLLGIAGVLGLFFLLIFGFALTMAGFAAGSVLRSADVDKTPSSTATEDDIAKAQKVVNASLRWMAYGVFIIACATVLWIFLRANSLEARPSLGWWEMGAIGLGFLAIWPLYKSCRELNISKVDSIVRGLIATLFFGLVQFAPIVIMLRFAQRSEAAVLNPYLTLVVVAFLLLAVNMASLVLAASAPIRVAFGGSLFLVILVAIMVPLYFQEPMVYSNLVVKHLNLGNTLAREVNLSPTQCRQLLGAQAANCPKDKDAVFPVSTAQILSNAGDEFVFRAWTCGWDNVRGPTAGLLQYPLRISSDGRPGVVEEVNGPLRTDVEFKAEMQCAELETGVCGIGSRGRIEKFGFNEEHFQMDQPILATSGEELNRQVGIAYRKYADNAHIIVFAYHVTGPENDKPAAPSARADHVYGQLHKMLDVPAGRIKRENSFCPVANAPVECAALPKNEQAICRDKPNHRVVDVWVVSPSQKS